MRSRSALKFWRYISEPTIAFASWWPITSSCFSARSQSPEKHERSNRNVRAVSFVGFAFTRFKAEPTAAVRSPASSCDFASFISLGRISYGYFKKLCGAFACRKTFLSKRSPPLGFIVAATDRPPRLYVSRYSPPGCFCGRPASTKRNSPQFPGNFSVDEPESLDELGCGLLVVVTFEFPEFADAAGAGAAAVPPVDAKFICTPVSAAPAAGYVPLIEPV